VKGQLTQRARFLALLSRIEERDSMRCPACKKQGFLEKLKVRANERTRRLTYYAIFAHPDGEDCESLCEVAWP
jgi:hypothetical protein